MRPSRLESAVAVMVVALIGLAGVAPSFAAGPKTKAKNKRAKVSTRIPSPTGPAPCVTGAGSHGGATDPIRLSIQTRDGVVELRGSGTHYVVESCVGRNALPTQEFVLLKAPASRRYVVARTVIPVRKADGTIELAMVAPTTPRSERSFRRAIPRPKRTVRLPGVDGVVFVPADTPLELLATRKNGKPIPGKVKLARAADYLLTGGVVAAAGG